MCRDVDQQVEALGDGVGASSPDASLTPRAPTAGRETPTLSATCSDAPAATPAASPALTSPSGGSSAQLATSATSTGPAFTAPASHCPAGGVRCSIPRGPRAA